MDLLSIFGVAIAFAAIIGGNYLEGGHFASLVNIPAGVIVLGGTLGASLLQSPWVVVRRALRILIWALSPPNIAFKRGVDKVVAWAQSARKEGLLGLEALAETEPDMFARKGLQLLVDGNEPDIIRNVLEVETTILEQRDIDFMNPWAAMRPQSGLLVQ